MHEHLRCSGTITQRSNRAPKRQAHPGHARTQCILRHKLLSNLAGEASLDAAGDIDLGQLPLLKFRAVQKLPSLTCEVGMFGVGLRAEDIFSRRHGHGAGDQTSHTRKQDIALETATEANPRMRLAVEMMMPSFALARLHLDHRYVVRRFVIRCPR